MEGMLLSIGELLAGLAEECGELTQAALKYRRALYGENPIPIDHEQAYDNLCEEIADVLLYLDQIPYNKAFVREIKDAKLARWKDRLKKAGKTFDAVRIIVPCPDKGTKQAIPGDLQDR